MGENIVDRSTANNVGKKQKQQIPRQDRKIQKQDSLKNKR